MKEFVHFTKTENQGGCYEVFILWGKDNRSQQNSHFICAFKLLAMAL
jgi:hypothetical protein